MQVEVITTDGRGFTPEELSDRCAKKIVSVADTAPPAIRDQAYAFQSAVEATVNFYMHEAVRNDRLTVYNALLSAGHPKLAELVKDL